MEGVWSLMPYEEESCLLNPKYLHEQELDYCVLSHRYFFGLLVKTTTGHFYTGIILILLKKWRNLENMGDI